MREHTIAVIVILILGAVAVGTRAQDVARPRPIDDIESYAVFAALLPNQWTVTAAKAKRLVFQEETTTYPRCEPSGPPMEGDWRSVRDSYRLENATPRLLLAGRDLRIPYIIISAADFKSAFVYDPSEPTVLGWDRFYKRYPDSGGVMSVSAVGFDSAKHRAMVYVGHSCNNLCGGGTYYFLEKVNSVWAEARIPGLRNCGWAS